MRLKTSTGRPPDHARAADHSTIRSALMVSRGDREGQFPHSFSEKEEHPNGKDTLLVSAKGARAQGILENEAPRVGANHSGSCPHLKARGERVAGNLPLGGTALTSTKKGLGLFVNSYWGFMVLAPLGPWRKRDVHKRGNFVLLGSTSRQGKATQKRVTWGTAQRSRRRR